jgi:hypothetical protein
MLKGDPKDPNSKPETTEAPKPEVKVEGTAEVVTEEGAHAPITTNEQPPAAVEGEAAPAAAPTPTSTLALPQ